MPPQGFARLSSCQQLLRQSKATRLSHTLLFPVPKDLKQFTLNMRWDHFLRERTDDLDSLPHLLNVIAASRASRKVSLEAHLIVWRQCRLEVIGDYLNQFTAGDT